MASTTRDAEPLCPDWVMTSSNVHAAKDRGWFSDYHPFESRVDVGCNLLPPATSFSPVKGIGTVILPVKKPNRPLAGYHWHGSLILRNVLHAPGLSVNIMGCYADGEDWIVDYGDRGEEFNGTLKDGNGQRLAYFKPWSQCNGIRLAFICLSGPPIGPRVGPSPLDPGSMYMLSIRWPDSEREKLKNVAPARSQIMTVMPNALTPAEKRWLKQHFGGEYKFLQMYGLSIYKDEDVAEGRVIMRAMMSYDEENEAN